VLARSELPLCSTQTNSTEIEPKKTYTSRRDRPTHSLHIGDTDFPTGEVTEEDIGDATWAEVCNACCVHTGGEWAWIFGGVCGVVFFLYFFLFALDLLGNGAKVMTGCSAGALFGDDTNPVAGVMIGIIATVLLQSSSTTTSIVVSLTGSAITVSQGIYMSKFCSDDQQIQQLLCSCDVVVFSHTSCCILPPHSLTSAVMGANIGTS